MTGRYKIKRVPRVRGENEAKGLCLFDAISTYAGYINRDYEMMFLRMLEIHYTDADRINRELNKNRGIGSIDIISNPLEDLKSFHGIIVTKCEKGIADIRRRYLEGVSLEVPLVMSLDSYWCHWDKSYRRFHSNADGHTVFVLDIDDVSGDWLLMDPYDNKEEVIMSKEDVECGYMYHYIFQNKPQTYEDNVVKTLKQEVDKLILEGHDRMLINLANEISQDFKFEDELMDNIMEVHQTDLYIKISHLKDSREVFCVLIDYIGNKQSSFREEFDEIHRLIIEEAKELNVILVLLSKAFLTSNEALIKNRVSDRIIHLAQLEVTMLGQLQDLCCKLLEN